MTDAFQTQELTAPWPHYAEDEIAAATRVLQSGKVNYWTGGEGAALEREFAASVGTTYSIALANGTLALEACLRGLGVGPNDDVIVPPRTFMATASACVAVGAMPVFADVDHDSGNVTAASVESVLTARTKAVIVVHLGGWPCDLTSLRALCDSHGVFLIEDCAQANGALWNGAGVGSVGHANAFSFCQDKIISSGGEGGMMATSDEAVFRTAWSYKDHGKGYEAVYHRAHPPGFRWLHESFGSNWRMTEVQAAVARVQLGKLESWISIRAAHAAIYREALQDISCVRVPLLEKAGCRHAYYRFYCYLRPEALAAGWDRSRVLEEAQLHGLPLFTGSCSELYREMAFVEMRPQWPELTVAKELGETSLAALVHPTLTVDQVAASADRLASILRRAQR